MKTLLQFCILIFSLIALHNTAIAQNWALIVPGEKMNFHEASAIPLISNTLHVDSQYVAGDMTVYVMNTIYKECLVCDSIELGSNDFDCGQQFGPPIEAHRTDQSQFVGFEIQLHSDSSWLLIDDVIKKILPYASVSQTWDYSNGITATVQETYASNIIGVQDSVKLITTSANDTILLSQNHGIIRWIEADEDYTLIGLETAGLGEATLRFKDVFHFNVGDYFQTRSYFYNGTSEVHSLMVDEILELIESTDTSFTYLQYRYEYNYFSNSNITESIDTVRYLKSDYPMLEVDPLEITFLGQDDVPFTYQLKTNNIQFSDTNFQVRAFGSHLPLFQNFFHNMASFDFIGTFGDSIPANFRTSDSSAFVWGLPLHDCSAGLSFGKGLGQTSSYTPPSLQAYTFWMPGAIISGDTLGFITDLSLIDHLIENQLGNLNIYPNPAQDMVRIEMPRDIRDFNGESIRILDITGKQLSGHSADESTELNYSTASELTIDVSHLPSGYYTIMLSETNGGFYSSKLLKE